ncbi:efflux RND transporter permease subunit, partial [Caminibacter pacificus]
MERLKQLKALLEAKRKELESKRNSACDINELKALEAELASLEAEIKAKEAELSAFEKEVKEKEEELKHVEEELQLNIAGKLARTFLKNPLTPVLAIVFMLMGLIAVLFTPREENPQIDVPAANVIVVYPGASSKEVQNVIVDPLERTLKAMTGVKHVYGMAMNSVGIVTVRFKIGQDKVRSMSKLYDRVMQNMDKLPKGV